MVMLNSIYSNNIGSALEYNVLVESDSTVGAIGHRLRTTFQYVGCDDPKANDLVMLTWLRFELHRYWTGYQ